MFCSNCGIKIENGAQFCQNCGDKAETKKTIHTEATHSSEAVLHYGQDWIRAKYFAVASLPYHDILVTKDKFYLLQFPKTHAGTWGLLIGLAILNIIGAVIGAAIGNSSDRKKRQKARVTWIVDNKLISSNYKDYVFIEVSKAKLKNHLSFERGKYVIITDGQKTVKLKKNKKEFTNFNVFIESYVL